MDNSFPHLQTQRLHLRQIVPADASVVLAGYSNPAVNKHMSVAYYSLDEVQEQLAWYRHLWESKAGIWWGFCLHDSGTMIGNGGYHNWHKTHRVAELGYWLLPEYQGHGYALEAIQAMVHHGFQGMDLHRVEAVVESDNYPSSQVLAKAGFTMEGIRRQCEWKETSFLDLQMWSRLSTDI